jgi:hypothetical protein
MGEGKGKMEQAQKQRPKHAPGDAVTVIQAANAFREHSRPFCEKARFSAPYQVRPVEDDDFGAMVASATNLAFAIELYVKALRMLNKLGPMHTHDLFNLYASLPKSLRLAIEATYEAGLKKLDPSASPFVVVRIAHRDAPQEDRSRIEQLPPDVANTSLERVLERSRDLFERWRYLYDQGEHGTVKWLCYEYRWLEVAADALGQHAMRALAAAQKLDYGL